MDSQQQPFFVPFDQPDLIGREHDVERLHQTLQSGRTTAVVPALVCQGGIGKTQIAVLCADGT
jgi:ATP-dependent Clp protease ATP-binding subunit ClpA